VVLVSIDRPTDGDLPGAPASGDAPGLPAAVASDNASQGSADDDSVPVGYVIAMTGPETAHIAELVVAPSHRRSGRGRRLLAGALDRLRETGATSVELAVEPDNDAARRLYEAFGFEEKTRVTEYYEDGGTAVLMRRPL
jgi:ribosomal-protein-alanine N-acetyltransferase